MPKLLFILIYCRSFFERFILFGTSFLIPLASLVTLGVGVGFTMALVSNAFVQGVKFLTSTYENNEFFSFTLLNQHYSLLPLFVIILAAFLIIYVRKVFGLDRFYGPADSIYAAHRADNELDVRRGWGSTLSAFISASGGASVGQYGPLVHFGATMGSYLKQISKSNIPTDIFLGCGVAAAISAGFNAPIAGILFAHNAIIRHFSLKAVAPIAVSSLVAASFSQSLFGNNVAFQISSLPPDLISVIPLALVVGPVFGLISIVLMNAIRYMGMLGTKSKLGYVKLTLIGATLCGVIGVFVPEVLGLGTETVRGLLSNEIATDYLIILLIFKILATALCIGLGMFGGVFSPAIFIGAVSGALIGAILTSLTGNNLLLVFTIAGMAAVTSPVVGAPISIVMVILELTASYDMALVSLGSVVTSSLTVSILFGYSFFDRQLQDRGIDIRRGRGHLGLMETSVGTIVTNEFLRLEETDNNGTAIDKMVAADVTEAYLLDDKDIFIGKIIITDIVKESPDAFVMNYLLDNPLSIKSDASLQQCIEVASEFVGETIPIIDRKSNTLRGVVSEADIFQAYLKLQNTVIDLETK
ncbi:MAG TPA: chloride channel protein [Rhodobiaceae bacterium]|nr:chloride channel protein [Rhodobiaceae bacterium]